MKHLHSVSLMKAHNIKQPQTQLDAQTFNESYFSEKGRPINVRKVTHCTGCNTMLPLAVCLNKSTYLSHEVSVLLLQNEGLLSISLAYCNRR